MDSELVECTPELRLSKALRMVRHKHDAADAAHRAVLEVAATLDAVVLNKGVLGILQRLAAMVIDVTIFKIFDVRVVELLEDWRLMESDRLDVPPYVAAGVKLINMRTKEHCDEGICHIQDSDKTLIHNAQ